MSFFSKFLNQRFSYLVVLTVFFLILLVARLILAESFYYSFFAWNLFLALIPLPFIIGAINLKKQNKQPILMYFLIFLCFAFFPNSAYLITDIIHIRPINPVVNLYVPYWFDVMYFLNVAIIGVFAAFESLKLFLDNYIPQKGRFVSSIFVWFISCIGIYIGREWRFNSWDILFLPFQIHQQDIQIQDLLPFLTVWPVSLALWFYFWNKKLN